jgi:hypothetical protein
VTSQTVLHEGARHQATVNSLTETAAQLVLALAHERGARAVVEAQLADARREIDLLKSQGTEEPLSEG